MILFERDSVIFIHGYSTEVLYRLNKIGIKKLTMKKLDLLILFLILYSLSISGQERSKQKDKNYLTWVSLINGQRNMKVLLY